MENDNQNRRVPPTADVLRQYIKTLQTKRLLNEQRNPPLPALEIFMILSDPDPKLATKFPRKPAETERCCIATPDEQGNYVIHQDSYSTCKVDYTPLLTEIKIDPENPIALLIGYRIVEGFPSKKTITPEPSDLTLSIPFATPCIREVAIVNESNLQTDELASLVDLKNIAHKKLDLGIVIEKITHPDLEEEVAATKMLHDMASKQNIQ
jgi:hypothetical protein